MNSHVSGRNDQPLIEQTIGQVFDQISEAHAQTPALISRHQDIRLSYAQLRDQVDRLCLGLIDLGLNTGDRVGIWAPNCAEWVVVQFATAKLGLILVNVNPAYRLSEVEYAINKVGMRMLIMAARFKSSDYVQMIQTLAPELAGVGTGAIARLPSLEHVLLTEAAPSPAPGMRPLADLMAHAPTPQDLDKLRQIGDKLSCQDAINIQFTSGTTGAPKGATLTHRNILNNGFFVVEALGLKPGEAICLPVPLYHCFGMVMGNLGLLTHGGTMVFPAPAFDPVETLRAIEQERCAALYSVPTMFIAMLDELDKTAFDLSALRSGIMAGSPAPIEVMRRVIDQMGCREIAIAYGMTETSPVSLQTAMDDPIERRVSTVGQVQPHAEVKIIDITMATVPRGVVGELCTKGYLVMQGYWGDPERTRDAIDADGFMHTGDLAVMDDAGYVNIVGRSKDMVIRGGENIYPREVEEFLYRHPDISDVQVIGVPDAKFGEELCAVVVATDQTLDADRVRAFCDGQIAHFKIPRYVELVEAFPLTVTGKVQKFKLREDMSEKLGLQAVRTA